MSIIIAGRTIVELDHILFDRVIGDMRSGRSNMDDLAKIVKEMRRMSSDMAEVVEAQQLREDNRYIGGLIERAAEIFQDAGISDARKKQAIDDTHDRIVQAWPELGDRWERR